MGERRGASAGREERSTNAFRLFLLAFPGYISLSGLGMNDERSTSLFWNSKLIIFGTRS